jgi:hypothetical protein
LTPEHCLLLAETLQWYFHFTLLLVFVASVGTCYCCWLLYTFALQKAQMDAHAKMWVQKSFWQTNNSQSKILLIL